MLVKQRSRTVTSSTQIIPYTKSREEKWSDLLAKQKDLGLRLVSIDYKETNCKLSIKERHKIAYYKRLKNKSYLLLNILLYEKNELTNAIKKKIAPLKDRNQSGAFLWHQLTFLLDTVSQCQIYSWF